MKIFTGNQIKEWDIYTIENEPIESIALMERAAEVIAQAICSRVDIDRELLFLIGKGNNGGDGLAVARMLSNVGYDCKVYMAYNESELSEDNLFNYKRLPSNVTAVTKVEDILKTPVVVVDALIGSGLNSPLSGRILDLVTSVNNSNCEVVAIDLPTGLLNDYGNDNSKIIRADLTLTIEIPKLGMLLPEAGGNCGELIVLSIDLHKDYIKETHSNYYYVDDIAVKELLKTRAKFTHKGNYGHALLICGSEGMIGAAILATCAALRSGCGLVTSHIPSKYATALYGSAPSAMVSLDNSNFFSTVPSLLNKYTSVGVGCGLGGNEATETALQQLFTSVNIPLVIDADAINLVFKSSDLVNHIPNDSIITPHPGELKGMIGEWGSDKEKLTKTSLLAAKLNCYIIIKGAYSVTCTPSGEFYFNSTGNPGMAKAGSGDVLTGLLTGLLARGYNSLQTCILGTYIHGKAGDIASAYYGQESVNSSDIIDFIADAYNELLAKQQ